MPVFAASAIALLMAAGSLAAPSAVEAAYKTFGNGTHRVGQGVSAGTYRTRSSRTNCYWARLSGFSGEFSDIKANSFSTGYQVVTILSADKGIESSRCGTWTSNLSRVTSSMTQFGQGFFIVGTDMVPGTYRSSTGGSCYWARLKGFTGDFSQIIANHFGARGLVTIRSTDRGFESSRCGTWTKV